MATTTTRLGLKVIDTPVTDTVDQLRLSINNHATVLDAQYLESTYALRPAAATKGRIHRSTDTGEVAIDTGTSWEPVWGPPSISRSVLDVGQVGQTRAGRQLAAADFTDCGLSAPVALWNLGGLTDVGGGGLSLTNKGSVTFGTGIEGVASSAAVFSGSTSQALYRSDTGAGDPLRIRTGSVGCWVKTAKRGVAQGALSRWRTTGNLRHFTLFVDSGNRMRAYGSIDGTAEVYAQGAADVCDDRWHFVVAVYDGASIRLYVDGQLDGVAAIAGPLSNLAVPLNVGSNNGADSGTAATDPWFGRADEAFVTNECMTPEQIAHMYGVKIAHGMATAPRRASLRVTRRRRGAAFVNGDFPGTPARAHTFAAGSLNELNGGAALTASGTATAVAGPDGLKDSATFVTGGSYLRSTDTGLPSGTSQRSHGCWVCAVPHPTSYQNFLVWGANGSNVALYIDPVSGRFSFSSAGDAQMGWAAADGKWHHVVAVEDNAAADGLKRKLYVDGRLSATSTTLNSLTLAGANAFRLGADATGAQPLAGAVSRAFVYAGALTWEQVQALYTKSAAMMPASPKEASDHVEWLGAASLIFNGDGLEPQHLIDLEVSR